MSISKIRRIRLAHSLFITGLVLVVVLEQIREAIPYWEFLIAGSLILVWILGIRYERAVVVLSGLATRQEVKEAEKTGYQWLFPDKTSDR